MAEVKLILKKIPNKLTEKSLLSVLDKAIKDQYYDLQFVKPTHIYDTKNNNLCFLTVKDIDTRLQLVKFLEEFDFISNKGVKQKLKLDVCIIQQSKSEEALIDDELIDNSYENLLHFKKFKEFFENGEIVKFKQNEGKCKLNLLLFLLKINFFTYINFLKYMY